MITSSTISGPLTISIRLFAAYAELVGESRVELSMPSGTTIGDLLAEFRRRFPRAAGLPARPLCAVNLTHVLPSHELRDGDEVAILPPLAGG